MEKEIQKNRKGKRGALAGRRLASSPLAEASPARERAIPLLAPAPASTHDGRPRRAAVASRQGSATAWRASTGLDTPWSATRSARPRPPPPPRPFEPLLSLSLLLSPSPVRSSDLGPPLLAELSRSTPAKFSTQFRNRGRHSLPLRLPHPLRTLNRQRKHRSNPGHSPEHG